MEGDGGKQNGHQRSHDDCHSEARSAKAIPGRDWLQHPRANKGKGYGVGEDHPLAVLLEVSIARHEEGGGCDDHPCAGLNDDGCNKIEIAVFTVRVGHKNGEWGSDEDRDYIEAAKHSMKRRRSAADSAGKLKRAAEQGHDAREDV